MFLKCVKNFFLLFNIAVLRRAAFENLIKRSIALDDISLANNEIKLIKSLNADYAREILLNWSKSTAQLRQDLIVLSHYSFKKAGYFVEFGAANGFKLSNTYLMEKEYQWEGILAEPGRVWHEELLRNRSSSIELNCVWSESGNKLEFEDMREAELSMVRYGHAESDMHHAARVLENKYTVETISLVDMLRKHNAPTFIEYLSVDTEGSEFIILNNFDFDKYTFGFISVEHNYTSNRKMIYDLLTSKGYKRIHEDLSLFDDWYVFE